MENSGAQPESSTPNLDNLERISKFGALVLLGLYAVGFVVVSLHYSTFGFTDFNPLKPKIISAGIWLLVFAGIPVSTLWRIWKFPPGSIWKNISWALPYYIGCLTVSLTMTGIFDFQNAGYEEIGAHLLPHLEISFLIFLVMLFIVKGTNLHEYVAALISAVAVAVLFSLDVISQFRAKQVQPSTLVLWFFVLGGLVIMTKYFAGVPNLLELSSYLFLLLGVVSLFTGLIYPHIKSSWGGGSPIPVVLFMSKDSPLVTIKSLEVRLVDEADNGFYVLPRDERKALFIPRSAVSLVYFGEQTKDSPLLSKQP